MPEQLLQLVSDIDEAELSAINGFVGAECSVFRARAGDVAILAAYAGRRASQMLGDDLRSREAIFAAMVDDVAKGMTPANVFSVMDGLQQTSLAGGFSPAMRRAIVLGDDLVLAAIDPATMAIHGVVTASAQNLKFVDYASSYHHLLVEQVGNKVSRGVDETFMLTVGHRRASFNFATLDERLVLANSAMMALAWAMPTAMREFGHPLSEDLFAADIGEIEIRQIGSDKVVVISADDCAGHAGSLFKACDEVSRKGYVSDETADALLPLFAPPHPALEP